METNLRDIQGQLQRAARVIEGKDQTLEGAIRQGAQVIKQLGGELKSTVQEVQCLVNAVREDTQDIKQNLGEVMGQALRDRLSARSSQVPGGQFEITSLLPECLIVLFKSFSFTVVLDLLYSRPS